jgi:hypothetical protein
MTTLAVAFLVGLAVWIGWSLALRLASMACFAIATLLAAMAWLFRLPAQLLHR